MLQVEHGDADILVSESVAALLSDASAITDYRTLRDSLPKRLAHLLRCRSVLFYQKVGETLQFASGTFDDKPGWSADLLAFAHINPVALDGDEPEALAWRTRATIIVSPSHPTRVIAPLVYRQRCLGVLVAIRTKSLAREHEKVPLASSWTQSEVQAVTALTGVVAILLENTRLIERDRERVYALSQLTTISNQMPYSLYEPERLKTLVVQRVREIARVDVCEMIDFSTSHEKVAWTASELYPLLATHFHEQTNTLPLVIERPGDSGNSHSTALLRYIAPEINTFFAFPLLGTRPVYTANRSPQRIDRGKQTQASHVLGVVVAGYHHAWKLRREESMLIQVVVGQAGAVLENMHLVIEVIEARNEARKLLRRVLEDQRFQALILESIPSGLITTDMQGRITTFNCAAETILGYGLDNVIGKSLSTLLDMHADSQTQETSSYFVQASSLPDDALARVLLTGEPQSGTRLSSNQQGEELVLDLNVQPLRDDDERQVGALITFVDVTSVHRLEEEKRRLDRLAVLGEMSAGLAHEIRNPLASIKTSIQMLMDDLSDETMSGLSMESSRVEIAQESTSVMLKEVERLDTLVRDMLLFARPRQLHRVRCDIPALSDHVLHLLQAQYADAHIQVQRNYEAVPVLWADMGQIEQVLLNLYANAMQAMADGGVLTITCRVVGKQGGETSQWVELSVADTGAGISSQHLDAIFKPFFTTKAHGIGLGLPITRRFIEDHGGTLSVESEINVGTTFIIRLPIVKNIPEEE